MLDSKFSSEKNLKLDHGVLTIIATFLLRKN